MDVNNAREVIGWLLAAGGFVSLLQRRSQHCKASNHIGALEWLLISKTEIETETNDCTPTQTPSSVAEHGEQPCTNREL